MHGADPRSTRLESTFELHEAAGVARDDRIDAQRLELVDLVKSLLQGVVGQLARLRVVLEDLVVEDGVVEGEAELDGVAGGQLDGVGLFVGLLSLRLDLLEAGVARVLSNVAVVVAHHLDEEGLGLVAALAL